MKISEARKGMVFTEEHRENLSKAHTGNRPDEVTRNKMSAVLKGHTVSGKTRALIRAKRLGKKAGKNETGKKYGKLTVIKRAETKPGMVYWICRCDCGKGTIVSGRALRTGNTKSCGCLHRESLLQRLGKGEAAFRRALAQIKSNARRRDYSFELTNQEAKQIMTMPCFYCGNKPSNHIKNRSGNGDFYYNGLDRIDNTQGYIRGNVVPSCAVCNWAKGTMAQEEFINHFRKVVNLWDTNFTRKEKTA